MVESLRARRHGTGVVSWQNLIGSACGLLTAVCIALPATAQDRILSWGYNTYGMPGMIDMPTAFGREDGELAFTVSSFARQTRNTLTFQVSPRLSASFRYALLYNVRPEPTSAISDYRFDRSFSVHFRAIDEGRYRPAVAIGINDLLGTGIYAGEYVVMSKALGPRVRASLGLGWGRLGSYGGFENPLAIFGDSFKDRPGRSDIGLGGQFQYQSWFKGDAAFFGGVEWQATDRLRLVVEYSSDDQVREDGAAFTHKSPLNFGLSYRWNDRTTVTANYLYGSEIGIQLSYTVNPKHPRFGSGLDTAPPPVRPVAQGGSWLDLETGGGQTNLAAALSREGVVLDGIETTGSTLKVQIRNDRYAIAAQAVGRAARVLSRLAPPRIERFDIRLAANGMPLTSVVLRRKDLEELEFHPVAPDLLRSRTWVMDAPAGLPPLDGRYPALSYGLEPYLVPSLFDPASPLRVDVGIALRGRYEPLPGLVFSGVIQQKLAGNIGDAARVSDSVLPHVRSDGSRYFSGSGPSLPELTAAYYFRPGKDLSARLTVGYLERMFGGVSAELLWKPVDSRLALGVEVNYVKQRDYDQLLGFRDYEVATGHVSAYYDFGNGFHGQVDVGRYLAGDWGATFTLDREFANGWKVGAFATLTDVSFDDFGEGSFDKGVRLTIPVNWMTGTPSRASFPVTLRPVLRDGGARLEVDGRLYESIRDYHAHSLDTQWERFWR